jgi:hypothetical protein
MRLMKNSIPKMARAALVTEAIVALSASCSGQDADSNSSQPHFAGQAPSEVQTILPRLDGSLTAVDSKAMTLTINLPKGPRTFKVTPKTKFTVRVVSMENTAANAKAGVMIRESLNANASEVGVWVTLGSGIVFTARTSMGGSTTTATSSGKAAPYWVRIARTGNSFRSYYSANGTTWMQIGSTTTDSMAASTYIDMGVESGISNVLNAANMDNVINIP